MEVSLAALEQIERLAFAQEAGQHAILNGTRMTAAKAIILICGWAQQGILASELIIVDALRSG